MVNCPGCGNPLVKRSSNGRHYCENDGCPVIFVRRPQHLAFRKITYRPSTSNDTIRQIERTRMHVSLCKSRISQNWQTTIQREARAILGVKKGDEIQWLLKNDDIIIRKIEQATS